MEIPASDHVIHVLDDQGHSVQTLRRFSFSKPKSRFAEFSHRRPVTQKFIISESEELEPLKKNDDDSDDDESEDEDNDIEGLIKEKTRKKINWWFLIEWISFITISSALVCSLAITTLKKHLTSGIELWRWALMMLAILSGRLVSGWIIQIVVFFIEKNFMIKGKVLYFVYGLRRRIRRCVWLAFVLLSWSFTFNAKLHQKNKLVGKAFQALVAFLIGATIWLVKIVLVKVLASSFHVTTYFDRMKESVFHHYVLDMLSGPPNDDGIGICTPATRVLSMRSRMRKIDIEKLKKLSMQSTASAWTIKRLGSYVRSFGLTTISNTVDGSVRTVSEITSEWEARTCANRIFNNVAKPGAKYIEEDDLLRFLKRVEIHTIFPLFEGALETGKITKSAFRNWLVRAYYERKSLAHSLDDTKKAVQQLHKLASAIVSVIIVVESLTVTGVASAKVIAFMLTQLLLLGFTFQHMCKTLFESIVFVFVMHPFDIGDRCVIDGVQGLFCNKTKLRGSLWLIVEEMNILTTVFLRYDNEKIYYPNSVLITKPISNFYRSPEMCDTVDFTINASTPSETIIALNKAIQTYIESKPKHWNPKHSVIVQEIDNVDKLRMCLAVQHTINHQNYGDRNIRITRLILELKKMFERLSIKYNLLPQEVHLTQVNMGNFRVPLS
ncbi:hypothetical protein CASFOL_041848 [Castilleja foliolosa]|uniref:Mechanosensitive ion channel protein n=1 Tax=Castilleja foliolosa TaxID=1961234 RepID=A0ABD3B9F5_9LAMI